MTVFFDTNVLIYAFTEDGRRDRARDVLADGGCISVQVLNEFASVLRRKYNRSWPDIEEAIAAVSGQFEQIMPLTVQTQTSAIALARDHDFSFYDALIVAAAIEAGCDTLLTEDMQHGRSIGGLTIVNPFR